MANGYKVKTVNGRQITEHRHIMELFLGRKLKPDEHVHHIDKNKHNNDVSNLRLMSASDHRRIHAKDEKNYCEKHCPNCGAVMNKMGRPKKLDDKKIKALKSRGQSLAEIAKTFGVTRGAIQAALKRC